MRGVGLFLTLCAAVPALAQDVERLPLVGVLRINNVANNEPTATMLRDALAALGDVDGRDLRLEFRLAEGDAGRFPELAEALVRDRASIIVANGSLAIRAAQRATRTIPIVATTRDLVTEGFVRSFARPGGNVTGVSMLINELDAKRLEVLKEILPSARRFGVLIETGTRAPADLQPTADCESASNRDLTPDLGERLDRVSIPGDWPGSRSAPTGTPLRTNLVILFRDL